MIYRNEDINLLLTEYSTKYQHKMLHGYDDAGVLNMNKINQKLILKDMDHWHNSVRVYPAIKDCKIMDHHEYGNTELEMFLVSMETDCKSSLAKYLSTGNLNELNFRSEYIHQYVCIAERLGLEEVKAFCEEKLIQEITPHDSIDMLQIARAYGMKQLQDKCLRLIEIHFPKLWETPEFQYLGKNDLISLLENPVIRTLPCAVDAVKHWYNYEPELRQEGYGKMLNMLKNTSNPATVKENNNVNHDVGYVVMFTSAKIDSDIPRAVVMCLETGKSGLVKLGKIGHCGLHYSVCSQQKDVTEAPYIYVSGGKEKSANRVHKCDVIMNKWKEFGHLKHGRSQHGMVSFNDCVYVFGGVNDSEYRNEPTVEACKDGKHFKIVGHLCEAVRSSATIVFKNKIYIFGGILDNGEHSSSIQIFDPIACKSKIMGQLPHRMAGGKALVVDGKIYIMPDFGQMVEFDPHTGDTKVCAECPYRVGKFGMCNDGSDIYITGGIDKEGNATDTICKYSVFSGKWENMKIALPSSMAVYGCCMIKMQRDLAMVPLVD